MYPVFISLENKHCLIIGIGSVGERKLTTLLAYNPASILVVDTRPLVTLSETVRDKLRDSKVRFCSRPYTLQDFEGKFLVFAATSSEKTNREISHICQTKNILCNCITNPNEGDVFLPAIVQKGNMTLALSTGGGSPALARIWKNELLNWIEPRERMLVLMSRLRPLVLGLQMSSEENREIFRRIANSPLQECLSRKDRQQALEHLGQILPATLHEFLTELIDGIA